MLQKDDRVIVFDVDFNINTDTLNDLLPFEGIVIDVKESKINVLSLVTKITYTLYYHQVIDKRCVYEYR
jgi:hypothetical protein